MDLLLLQFSPQLEEMDRFSETVIKLAPKTPTLLFADPWGYKGLSIALIAAFLGVAGSDCVFCIRVNDAASKVSLTIHRPVTNLKHNSDNYRSRPRPGEPSSKA